MYVISCWLVVVFVSKKKKRALYYVSHAHQSEASIAHCLEVLSLATKEKKRKEHDYNEQSKVN